MRRAVVLGVVALALVLSGCGDDAPSDYNAEVEENFLQTCTDQGGDDLQQVCQCAYDSFEREIPFDRFQRVDERLADDPDAQLPDEFLDLYTDCVIQSGGGSAGTTPELPTTTTTATTLAPGASTTAPAVTDTTAAP
ncbi:MAG: hypothetical protein JNK12_22335 [Acidimicrobiales bacterium]|nr:hypothetical protein [Acidimicrobiales bacterium]